MDGSAHEKIMQAAAVPMAGYRDALKGDLADWMPLEQAAQLLLDGKPCDESRYAADFRPIIQMMRLIMEKTPAPGWSWADPDVQKVFTEVASGAVYRLYADVLIAMIIEILRAAPIQTVVEVGAGSGFVTSRLCSALQERGFTDIQLIVTDMLPSIEELACNLRSTFPALSIGHCCWNIQHAPPQELLGKIHRPVLVFERFSLPYAGYGAIGNLAAVSDVLLLVDDLNLTGEKAAFDHIYGRIGTQFLVLSEAHRHLGQYFSSVMACDSEVVQAIRSPVSTFTLAIK